MGQLNDTAELTDIFYSKTLEMLHCRPDARLQKWEQQHSTYAYFERAFGFDDRETLWQNLAMEPKTLVLQDIEDANAYEAQTSTIRDQSSGTT